MPFFCKYSRSTDSHFGLACLSFLSKANNRTEHTSKYDAQGKLRYLHTWSPRR